MLCERDARVVCRRNDNGFEKFSCLMSRACVQKDLRAAHTCRILTHFDVVVKRDVSPFCRLESEQRRHDFDHTCNRQAFLFVSCIEQLSRCVIDEICGFSDGFEIGCGFAYGRTNCKYRRDNECKHKQNRHDDPAYFCSIVLFIL